MNKVYNFIPPTVPLTELADNNGAVQFRKQIIRFGEWIDPVWPDDTMVFDLAYFQALERNFNAGVVGRVSVPLGHPQTPEELADWNRGELISLEIVGDGSQLSDGLYGVIEIRDPETADKIRSGLIWDDSISFTSDYVDNQTGMDYGPALLHVGLVNNPYIKQMGPFTELADSLKSLFNAGEVRMLSMSAVKSNQETVMSKVKNERDFAVTITRTVDGKEVSDVLEPGAVLEVGSDELEAVEKQLADATAPEQQEEQEEEAEQVEETEQTEEHTDLADDEASRLRRELADAKSQLLQKEVDDSYVRALSEGKIVPAQEEAFKSLSMAVHGQTRSLSDGTTQNLSEVFADFVSKAPKVVSLNDEQGKSGESDPKDPMSNLTEEQRKGLQASGVSAEDYAKYGTRDSLSINEVGAN